MTLKTQVDDNRLLSVAVTVMAVENPSGPVENRLPLTLPGGAETVLY